MPCRPSVRLLVRWHGGRILMCTRHPDLVVTLAPAPAVVPLYGSATLKPSRSRISMARPCSRAGGGLASRDGLQEREVAASVVYVIYNGTASRRCGSPIIVFDIRTSSTMLAHITTSLSLATIQGGRLGNGNRRHNVTASCKLRPRQTAVPLQYYIRAEVNNYIESVSRHRLVRPRWLCEACRVRHDTH